MTRSPLMTENVNTSQQSARTASPLNMVILHHGATTNADQIVEMMVSGSREVSAHAVVKDARRIGVVEEENRAWSLGSSYWDSRAFTVECANESTQGWTISASSHESLARLSADWAKRYNFPIVRGPNVPKTQWTLLGHREVYEIYGESYSTACPGGMNLDWIANRANEILNNGDKPENEEEEELVTRELVIDKTGKDNTIYYSVNRILLYPLPNMTVVKDYQYYIRSQGQSDVITPVASIASFGSIVK